MALGRRTLIALLVASLSVRSSSNRVDMKDGLQLAPTDSKQEESVATSGQGTDWSALFVVGDSHGDMNYLVRTLLATGLFGVKDGRAVWQVSAEGIGRSFEVVVLGDFTDRGSRSRACAMMLKTLSEDEMWGSHMVVLLGNHEGLLFEHDLRYAGSKKNDTNEDFNKRARSEALAATEGDSFELIRWMSERKVVYLSHGALMMHGGLSAEIATILKAKLSEIGCARSGAACGSAIIDYINEKAINYHKSLHECIQTAGRYNKEHAARRLHEFKIKIKTRIAHMRSKISSGRDGLLTRQDAQLAAGAPEACGEAAGGIPGVLAHQNGFKPSWSRAGGGVLWFRGYSALEDGANTKESCSDADRVGAIVGADMMVVAHTTHFHIRRFCNNSVERMSPHNAVERNSLRTLPIFAVDTHKADCVQNDECDFDIGNAFHKRAIDPNAKQVPQVLRIQTRYGGQRADRCLSMVNDRVVDSQGKAKMVIECFEV